MMTGGKTVPLPSLLAPASGPSASEPQTQQKRQMDAEGSGKKGWLVPGIPRAARRSPSWDRAQLAV